MATVPNELDTPVLKRNKPLFKHEVIKETLHY